MRFVAFTHSLVSDWNHGNAHFLRGIASEFLGRGWDVSIFEPRDGWSRANLLKNQGSAPFPGFYAAFPNLSSELYDVHAPGLQDELDKMLDSADIVLVHEWNDPRVVAMIGRHHAAARRPYRLFFHDTHHRMITAPESMSIYDLTHYDGVLAYGKVLRDLYISRSLVANAWTWHEAADIHTFYPRENREKEGDLVWIGNWGDGERGEELREFLIEPVRRLGLKATVHGVRYPDAALAELASAGIEYRGWLPNYEAPQVFSGYRVTVHIPRRPYMQLLPGIPTIRPFEALACAIPLISAPWRDRENLFRPGQDYLIAHDSTEMTCLLGRVLSDSRIAESLARSGLETIRSRHTCGHRVDELLAICGAFTTEAAMEGVA